MTDLSKIVENAFTAAELGTKYEPRDSLHRKTHQVIVNILNEVPVISSIPVQDFLLERNVTLSGGKRGYYGNFMSAAVPGGNPYIKHTTDFQYLTLNEAIKKLLGKKFPNVQISLTYPEEDQRTSLRKSAQIIYYRDYKKMMQYVDSILPEKPTKLIFALK